MKRTRTFRLGSVVTIVGGSTPTRSNPQYYDGDIPWVTPKDMKRWNIDDSLVHITKSGLDNSAAQLVPKDSILIVVRSGVLKHTLPIGLNRRPVALNQDMKALICSAEVHPNFLARLIKARAAEILSWVQATTADNFPVEKLRQMAVSIPSLDEQRRIGVVLDNADALRAKRRQALAHLDELTRSIFLEMFGNPSQNPHSWPIGHIADTIESATYGTSDKAGAVGEIPVLRMNNITTNGELDLASLKYTNLPPSKIDRFTIRQGDILFNRTNSPELVGKAAIYRNTATMAYAGYLIRLRVNKTTDSEYLVRQPHLS